MFIVQRSKKIFEFNMAVDFIFNMTKGGCAYHLKSLNVVLQSWIDGMIQNKFVVLKDWLKTNSRGQNEIHSYGLRRDYSNPFRINKTRNVDWIYWIYSRNEKRQNNIFMNNSGFSFWCQGIRTVLAKARISLAFLRPNTSVPWAADLRHYNIDVFCTVGFIHEPALVASEFSCLFLHRRIRKISG